MRPVLSVQNISASFGQRTIFYDVTFDIFSRNVLALVGPAGSGKTSVMRMICGLSAHQQNATFYGDILYKGQPVSENSLPVMVIQKAHMVIGTVFQNLANKYVEEHAENRSDMKSYVQSYLEGLGLGSLAEMLDKDVLDLSILQRKKLMIANTLMSNPALVCLDDPTHGLGEDDAHVLLGFLRTLLDRCAIMLTTDHQGHASLVADRICLIAGGMVQEHSSKTDFFENPKTQAAREFIQTGNCAISRPDVAPHELGVADVFALDNECNEFEISEVFESSESTLGNQHTELGLAMHLEQSEVECFASKSGDEWIRTPTSVNGIPFRGESYELSDLEIDQKEDEHFIYVIDQHFALHAASLDVESESPVILSDAPDPISIPDFRIDDLDNAIHRADTGPLKIIPPTRGPHGFYWLRAGVLAGTPQPGLFVKASDDLKDLKRAGVTHLITLTEQRLEDGLCRKYGITNIYYPIANRDVPDLKTAAGLCRSVADLIEQGAVVAYHCRSGIGRTGMMLVAQLIWDGMDVHEALRHAREIYRPWVHTVTQEQFLMDFQQSLGEQRVFESSAGKIKVKNLVD